MYFLAQKSRIEMTFPSDSFPSAEDEAAPPNKPGLSTLLTGGHA